MTGTILLIGGSGKTGTSIALRLQARGIPVLISSRKGQEGVPEGYKGITFDWYDESTYAKPFEADKNIDTVYIIRPPPKPDVDWIAITKKFIDFAKGKGVNRFLLMSGSPFEKGGPAHGQIHAYLEEIGTDWAVLRPSWFLSNLLAISSIKEKDEFISATGKGKIGFVSIDDIAETAVDLLSLPKLGGTERIIVGPELLSYNDVADIFTEVLGRKITHRGVSVEERRAYYASVGLPEQVRELLLSLEADHVAKGEEEKNYETKNTVVGKVKAKDFIERNKAVWSK